MIIQAPRQTILRCDAIRCGDIEELHPLTEIEARLWMGRKENGWTTTKRQKHYCKRCSVVERKAA